VLTVPLRLAHRLQTAIGASYGPTAGGADEPMTKLSSPDSAVLAAPLADAEPRLAARATALEGGRFHALVALLRAALAHPRALAVFAVASLAYSIAHAGQALIVKAAVDAMTGRSADAAWVKGLGLDAAGLLTAVVAIGAVLLVIEAWAQGVRRYEQLWIAHRVSLDLRTRIARHLLTLDVGSFQARRTGDLLTRMTGDLQEARTALDALGVVCTRPLTLLAAGVAVVLIDWRLAVIGLGLAGPASVLLGRVYRRIRRRSRAVRDQRADLSDTMMRFLTGISEVKAFGAEAHEGARFERDAERLMALSMRAARAQSRVQPLLTLGSGLGSLLVLWAGGRWVASGALGVGDLVGLVAALGAVLTPARQLGRSISALQEALPAVERALEVTSWRPRIEPGTTQLSSFSRAVRFEGVRFGYAEGGEVLRGVDLELPRGRTVALVGPSGSGKSTIASLLLRFYDPTRGRVSIDGVDLRELDHESLRRTVSVVGQEAILFDCSIRDNIAYGRPDATDAQIEAAARAAHIHDTILALPDGYRTVVGERGARLSGGQRQRISIARALLCDAPVLILDEATSALDAASEAAVQSALDRLLVGRTALVIAHRLSTVRNADEILVLESGRITARGRHESLLHSSETYAELVRHQTWAPEPEATLLRVA
jgi:ABC-type multidrug transport system fused ATPase/permease subunit